MAVEPVGRRASQAGDCLAVERGACGVSEVSRTDDTPVLRRPHAPSGAIPFLARMRLCLINLAWSKVHRSTALCGVSNESYRIQAFCVRGRAEDDPPH